MDSGSVDNLAEESNTLRAGAGVFSGYNVIRRENMDGNISEAASSANEDGSEPDYDDPPTGDDDEADDDDVRQEEAGLDGNNGVCSIDIESRPRQPTPTT